MVRDGVAYFAAGRSSFLDGGIRLLRIDAQSGKLLSETLISSYDRQTGKQVEAAVRQRLEQTLRQARGEAAVGDDRDAALARALVEGELLGDGGRGESGAAIGTVDVKPEISLAAEGRDLCQGVDGPGADGAGRGR